MSIPHQEMDVSPADMWEEPEPTQRFDRVPPQDLDAEQSVLGAMLLHTAAYTTDLAIDAIADAVDILGAPGTKVFYKPAHEKIYRCIYTMWNNQEPADPITVAAELTKTGELASVGGAAYLHSLVQVMPTAANATYYAEIVVKCAKRRKVIEICTKAVADAYSGAGDEDQIVEATLAGLQDLTVAPTEAPKLSVADRWYDYLRELEEGEDPSAIDSPYKDLNSVVSVKAGDVVTIGAETSGGKSLVAGQWGAHVAMKLDKPVLMFSMEMNANSLMNRLVALTAKVDLGRLDRKKDLTDSDWEKIRRVDDVMSRRHNFVLIDDGSVTLSSIRARARWMATRGMPVGLIIVDYLQLMETENSSSKGNRAQEVADISRGLKRLAMDFNVPVISLAQFNREAKNRKPQVTDFKESSSIEQDSSVILLMHSERDENGDIIKPDEVTMTVAKNRNGVRGHEIELIKRAHYARLDDKAWI